MRGKGKQQFYSYLRNNDKNSVKQSRLTSTVISHNDSMYSCCDVMRMAFYLCGFLPKNHNPRIITRKTLDKTQLKEGHSVKCQIIIPQNRQDHQKEKSEKLSQL